MRIAGDQRYGVVRNRNRCTIYDFIVAAAYLHVVLFTKHQKETSTEVYLEPSQIPMTELSS